MPKVTTLHALIFDETSYYVLSYQEALELTKKDSAVQIVRMSNDLDFLFKIADKLNEEI